MIFLILAFALLISAGYYISTERLSWENGWKKIPLPTLKSNIVALTEKADFLTNQANSLDRLETVIDVQKRILNINPLHFETLWKLSRNTRFHGQIYASNVQIRRASYLQSIQLAERALYTNQDFKKLIDSNTAPWNATEALCIEDLPALHYYFLGIFSMFLTDMNKPKKLINAHWINRSKAFVKRMIELDHTWGGGHPHYDRALYLCQLPSWLGGDMNKAGEEFEKAITIGPLWVNNYYMRARVYRTKLKDKRGFVSDLNIIANMDPKDSDAPFPNSCEYIRQAQIMLKNVNSWFT
jgi:tetratricopeptide (TPR) repeat protein